MPSQRSSEDAERVSFRADGSQSGAVAEWPPVTAAGSGSPWASVNSAHAEILQARPRGLPAAERRCPFLPTRQRGRPSLVTALPRLGRGCCRDVLGVVPAPGEGWQTGSESSHPNCVRPAPRGPRLHHCSANPILRSLALEALLFNLTLSSPPGSTSQLHRIPAESIYDQQGTPRPFLHAGVPSSQGQRGHPAVSASLCQSCRTRPGCCTRTAVSPPTAGLAPGLCRALGRARRRLSGSGKGANERMGFGKPAGR